MAETTVDSVETLLKADSVTLAVAAERSSGNLRLSCMSWDSPKVARPGEAIELRYEHGQVVVSRKGGAAVEAPLVPEMFESAPGDWDGLRKTPPISDSRKLRVIAAGEAD